mgnify:FL=1
MQFVTFQKWSSHLHKESIKRHHMLASDSSLSDIIGHFSDFESNDYNDPFNNEVFQDANWILNGIDSPKLSLHVSRSSSRHSFSSCSFGINDFSTDDETTDSSKCNESDNEDSLLVIHPRKQIKVKEKSHEKRKSDIRGNLPAFEKIEDDNNKPQAIKPALVRLTDSFVESKLYPPHLKKQTVPIFLKTENKSISSTETTIPQSTLSVSAEDADFDDTDSPKSKHSRFTLHLITEESDKVKNETSEEIKRFFHSQKRSSPNKNLSTKLTEDTSPPKRPYVNQEDPPLDTELNTAVELSVKSNSVLPILKQELQLKIRLRRLSYGDAKEVEDEDEEEKVYEVFKRNSIETIE